MRCRWLILPLVLWVCPILACPQAAAPIVPAAPPKPMAEVQTLLDKATTEGNAYHWDAALQLYNQALDKARALQDKAGEATTLNNIGEVYQSTGKPQKALDFY